MTWTAPGCAEPSAGAGLPLDAPDLSVHLVPAAPGAGPPCPGCSRHLSRSGALSSYLFAAPPLRHGGMGHVLLRLGTFRQLKCGSRQAASRGSSAAAGGHGVPRGLLGVSGIQGWILGAPLPVGHRAINGAVRRPSHRAQHGQVSLPLCLWGMGARPQGGHGVSPGCPQGAPVHQGWHWGGCSVPAVPPMTRAPLPHGSRLLGHGAQQPLAPYHPARGGRRAPAPLGAAQGLSPGGAAARRHLGPGPCPLVPPPGAMPRGHPRPGPAPPPPPDL